MATPRIHHATLARAQKKGIALKVVDDRVKAFYQGRFLVSDEDPKLALQMAEEEVGEIRRSEYDREDYIPREQRLNGNYARTTKVDKPQAPAKSSPPDPPPSETPSSEVPQVIKGSIVNPKYKKQYGSGQNNGDDIAVELQFYCVVKDDKGRERTSEVMLRQVCEVNEIDFSRYEHLNIGQQRMNVGNRLRGRLKKGKPVKIGDVVFTD